MMHPRQSLTVLAGLAAILALARCSSGSSAPAPAGAAVRVTVSPHATAIRTGASVQLQATVENAASSAVVWSVDEAGGGAVTPGGLYTAPSTAGSYHVVATSVADPTKSDAATVTVTTTPPPVVVNVTPRTASVQTGSTQQFAAAVTNATDGRVTWSVQEGAAGGSVGSTGLYTAPSTAGSYHVVATSVADPTKSDAATVTVTTTPPPVGVNVTPSTASVQTGSTQQFTAAVTNATDGRVTWSVREGATGGAVSAAGLYTAPSTAGSYHVVATSVADPTKSDAATVTVTAPPPAVVVNVTPKTASVQTGSTQQFTAAVTNATDGRVTWSVREGAAGGSVGSTGLYAAPSTAGSYHVVATSVADPTKSDAATVTVTAPPPVVGVTISPTGATLPAGGSQQFTATVTGTTNTGVTWTLQEGAAGGSVGSTGLYTAPSIAGTYHVVATSVADPTKSAIALANVTSSGGGTCSDACPAPSGVTWACEKRFAYGTNWAWRNWAADFGGSNGVSKSSATYSSAMAAMKARGVSVIRWWMFPRFVTSSITWGTDGAPTGIGGTLLADVREALRLADVNGVYLMLTPFSFDNFKFNSSAGDSGPSLAPMVTDPVKRQKLLDNVMKPIAQAVEASPYKSRMLAWDMMNEPEWVISGADLYGGPAFEPQGDVDKVTHAQMETFLNELAGVLHANCGSLVTVGSAAIKWAKAWTHTDVDFYQLHYYDWVYQWFPYQTATLASVGLTDKPVVMGEFPNAGLSASGTHPARTASQFAADLWAGGYAGSMTWMYGNSSSWTASDIQLFPPQHPCETAY